MLLVPPIKPQHAVDLHNVRESINHRRLRRLKESRQRFQQWNAYKWSRNKIQVFIGFTGIFVDARIGQKKKSGLM